MGVDGFKAEVKKAGLKVTSAHLGYEGRQGRGRRPARRGLRRALRGLRLDPAPGRLHPGGRAAGGGATSTSGARPRRTRAFASSTTSTVSSSKRRPKARSSTPSRRRPIPPASSSKPTSSGCRTGAAIRWRSSRSTRAGPVTHLKDIAKGQEIGKPDGKAPDETMCPSARA